MLVAKRLGGIRRFADHHSLLCATIVIYCASCFFFYACGQVAHWTNGIQQGKLAYDCKWDCGWYGTITANGYDAYPHAHPRQDAANWAFFPLFPASAAALAQVFRLDPATATVLASKLELFAAIFAFLLWLTPHLENTDEYYLAGALVGLNPYFVYAHTGYSEPLYFALLCLGFWALERENYFAAGAFGALVSATRLVGILFALVYAISVVRHGDWRSTLRKQKALAILLGLVLCPLGLALFSIHLYHRTGDALAFAHIQIAWDRHAANPLAVFHQSFLRHGWTRVWAAMATVAILTGVVIARKQPQYGIFLALSIIVPCLSGSMQSMPRYVWWQPPFLFAVFHWLRPSLPRWMIYFAFAGGIASIMVLYWFGNNLFVV